MIPFSRFSHYFAEVASSGSLRKAAEKLHVSASAINRQILQAEEDLNTRLFERLPEGMRLTTAGELLYADIRRWQREYQRTLDRIDEIQGLKRGHVSMGLIQAMNEGRLAEVLSAIASDHPWLRLDLSVDDSQTIGQRISEAELDFGLILDPEGQSGLEVIAFAELPLGVVLPADHPLSQRESLSPGELSDERHILPGDPLVVHDRVEMLYRRHAFSPDNIIVCNDIRLIKSLIKGGSGISILSRLDVLNEIREGTFCFVPLKGAPVRPLTLALCTAPSRQLSRAAQKVIQQITHVVEDLAVTD
ncbi:LysR family transcriptional regulator [Erwinia typographi]|uniref:LysR family transcriptional regulator n=1 Tax=Erwinia typographi TaxID=371042 RepID=A0A0A4A8Y1_9GAMM|nr:LysR family transcriptional regulator [Erwinia typographi]KGT94288.1 LysR family transcriptional regulator [Erwinia typographi]